MLPTLRRSPLYEIWRALRQQLQVRRIAPLVEGRDLALSGDAIGAARALRPLSAARRPLPARPRVVAFGTRDWEQWGLWPSFSRLGPFSLFDYRKSGSVPDAATRRRLGIELLRHVEQTEREGGPVDLVFAYAAGTWLDPEAIETLKRRGIWTVLMSLDDKQQLPGTQPREPEKAQLEAARAADLYWTTWRSGADWLAANGVVPWYAPEAADPEFFAPRDLARDIDVLWLGRAYGPRAGLVRWLRARGFSIRTGGPGWPEGMVSFGEMIALFSRAKVVLGMGGVGQTDRIKHLKGRDFEVPMCGAVYLTSFNPELTDHFDVGREILCYSSEVDCAETLAYVLRRPELAASIRAAARKRCLSDHTWEHRLEQLFAILRGAGKDEA